MTPIEWKWITPEEMIREIETNVRLSKENKYAFQVGLKDVDFDLNLDELHRRGFQIPFPSIAQAEQALNGRLIVPTHYIEYDDTEHNVLAFHPQPVGYSGFMDCVTHSLSITNHGLFEVGRYQAVSLDQPGKYWQWFIHQRLAISEQVQEWQDKEQVNTLELVDRIYQAITGW